MNTSNHHRRHLGARGFTLIEVLIAILVFSFGVLGAAAMQSLATQYATQNGDRSRASMLANEAVSQMWAAQTTATTSAWYGPWQTRVSTTTASGLPNGSGTVTACGANCATVTVKWRAPSAKTTAVYNQYVTSVVIQ